MSAIPQDFLRATAEVSPRPPALPQFPQDLPHRFAPGSPCAATRNRSTADPDRFRYRGQPTRSGLRQFGPYTDPAATIDLLAGLPSDARRLDRRTW